MCRLARSCNRSWTTHFVPSKQQLQRFAQRRPTSSLMHGETTSEKIALGRFLDGKVSAVIGTHTHVQTADEQIFPGGTAFLCDAGMCGPVNSILGRAVEPIVRRFITNVPVPFPVAGGEVRLRGAVVRVDEISGRAISISRVDESIETPLSSDARIERARCDSGNAK